MEIINKEKISKVYSTIKQLRSSGIKMKEIAESTEITSSILSAMYSTVLPSFIEHIAKGATEEDALNEALVMVNNISKKRFYDMIRIMDERLTMIDFRSLNSGSEERLFFGDIEREAISGLTQSQNYSGIYLSYSRSSYKDALKIEPYVIQNIQKGEIMPKVAFSNDMGQEYWGVALFSPHQQGYIFINEQKNRRLGVRLIALQLPLFERPNVLKGLYMSQDYNHNPITRRIVLVKISDSTEIEEFNKLKARVVEFEGLNEEEAAYYDYTCCEGDFTCSLMYGSPVPNAEDLVKEKKMLKI